MKSNWPTKKLGDIFEIQRGGSPRPIKSFLTTKEDGINWIKIGDAKNGDKYIYKTAEKIKPEGLKKSRLVHEGDFLLSNSMSFGRPYILKTSGAIHDGWLVLRNKLKDIDKNFFYYLLSSPVVSKQFDYLAAGSTVRNLNTKLVASVVVPVPPLSEQHRIVKILDEISEKITGAEQNTEKNLQNSHELFDAYLQDILANPKSNGKEVYLKDVCEEIFAGGDVPKTRYSKTETKQYSIPIFANGVKDKGLYGYTDIKRVTKPSITISARGTIGYSEKRKDAFYPVVRLIVLTPNIKIVDLSFLYYATRNFKFSNTGSSIPQLTIPMVEKVKIKLPPLNEQVDAVEELDKLSAGTVKLENVYKKKLAELDEFKSSILKMAFTNTL